jgi:dimethylargininase
MLTALTRAVSPHLNACELEYLARQPIDLEKASEQHRQYEICLRELGARVIRLDAGDFPDGVFVEDPAIILDRTAVMCRMGAESRRQESISIAEALKPFCELKWIREPGTLEGGDVMRAGKTFYVGISNRSNREGAAQLADLTGYRVVPVQVKGCLHLKSACSYLGSRTVLANRTWIEPGTLDEFTILDVPAAEPAAANVLRIGETLLIPASFPETAALLERSGYRVRQIDISELQKAEAAVTCSSLIFESSQPLA